MVAQIQTASDADWAEAHRREKVIRPLAGCMRIPSAVTAQAMMELGVERSRFLELVKRYREAPAATSLLLGKRGREKGSYRLSEQAEHRVSVSCKTTEKLQSWMRDPFEVWTDCSEFVERPDRRLVAEHHP